VGSSSPDRRLRLAGVALALCSLAFVAVFAHLARVFDYPAVLQRSAGQVLPALAAGGPSLRAVWFLYAALPLGILAAGLASAPVLARGGQWLRTVGVASAVTAGAAMSVGLLRWPTLEWSLALKWVDDPFDREAFAAAFDRSNLILGNIVGEFIGELALASWFFALAIAHRRDGRTIIGTLGTLAGLLLAVAAFRNVTTLVAPVAALNNVTLPLWLLALGVILFRAGRPAARS
jgi:hypothetical protein